MMQLQQTTRMVARLGAGGVGVGAKRIAGGASIVLEELTSTGAIGSSCGRNVKRDGFQIEIEVYSLESLEVLETAISRCRSILAGGVASSD